MAKTQVQIGWLPEHVIELDEPSELESPGWDIEPLSAVNEGDRYALNGGPTYEYGYLRVFVEVEL